MNASYFYIETERLIIRPYEETDAPAFKEAIDGSIPELLPFMPFAKNEPSPISTKIELFKKWKKEIKEDKSYTLGIFNKKTHNFIGSTGFHIRNLQKRAFEIGYWVNTLYQKQGFITEASKALTTFAFDKLDAERIEIHCDEHNTRSSEIPKKLGYNHEFTYRLVDKDLNGKRIKNLVWYIFKEEWNN